MDIFNELVAWAKYNAKEGANVAEFEELVSKAAPPADTEQAMEYIRRIPSLKNALNSELNKEFIRATEKYEKEKLPEKEKALRESIRKELNPAETPEQKQIRELREKLEAKERVEAITARQNALRAKAKDFGLDPEIAADYAQYGDEAENVLKRHAEWHKKELDAIKAETARNAFGNKTPSGGGDPKGLRAQLMDQYNNLVMAGNGVEATKIGIQLQNLKDEG